MRFKGNNDIAVSVESISKATRFYEGVLGLKLLKEEPSLRVYDTGGFTLYVQQGEPHPPVPSFTVWNLHKAKNHLVENDCTILVELERSLYFRDPNGVVWDIIEVNTQK